MNFEHEDRCYYNRWLYEDENLHQFPSEDRFLEYFLHLMRDYQPLIQYSKSSYTIKQNGMPGFYIIQNNSTGERYFNRLEYIYKSNSFSSIKRKFTQNFNSSLNLIIDQLNRQSSENRYKKMELSHPNYNLSEQEYGQDDEMNNNQNDRQDKIELSAPNFNLFEQESAQDQEINNNQNEQ